MNTTDNSLSNQEPQLDGALQVGGERQNAVIKVGATRVSVPSLASCDGELDGFQKFLMATQLGSIERRKQKQIRELVAKAEIDILRDRTDQIISAHRALTQAALQEILIAAIEFGNARIRDGHLEGQAAIQRTITRAAVQYRDFIAQCPKDFPPGVFEKLQQIAEKTFNETIDKLQAACFRFKS